MKQALINIAHTKQYIKDEAKLLRPHWDCRQVSGEALELLNEKFKAMIRAAIRRHPTRGKTFTDLI